MSVQKKHVLIIAPIFYGSGTGSAVYYQLLVRELERCGFKCSVISEKATKEQSPSISGQFYQLFPRRTGKRKRFWQDIRVYALQNLSYRHLEKIVDEAQPNIVLVHSSFYALPGLFGYFMSSIMFKKRLSMNFILDVRDVLFSLAKVIHFRDYDAIIACSENVKRKLISGDLPKYKVNMIPVIQENISVSQLKINEALATYGLQSKKFIFYAGLVKEIKAVDVLLDVFINYVYPNRPDVSLVITGYLKTSSPSILLALHAPNVHYLGNLSRSSTLALIAGANLCVNLSPNESISRFSLEALALSRPVLLPPNVPEFETHCPDFVVHSREPADIANQIIAAYQHPHVPNYPISQHDSQQVVQQYIKIFEGVR